MTAPMQCRVLLAAPESAHDAAEVANLLRRYQPDVLFVSGGVGVVVADTVAGALLLPTVPLRGMGSVGSVVTGWMGRSVALLVTIDEWTQLLMLALGAPAGAATRFAVVPGAISVLECDDQGRWAAGRVNEGALPDPE